MTELLIVGGLTVDHFTDGASAPGGSVLHAGRAAADEGARLTFLTVAGDEPEARVGLARLAEMGRLVHQRARASTTYRHQEAGGRRVLVYEAATDAMDPAHADGLPPPDVALIAPIADELSATSLRALEARLQPRITVLLIQGWLRRLEVGAPVHPLPLDAVADDLWSTFGRADAVVLSTEDLAEAPEDPFAQGAELRFRLGPAPVLVLTLGTDGYLLDDPALDRVLAAVPRRVIEGVPTVGAGDTFGAALAVHLGRGEPAAQAADAATERVISVLAARRP
ncbi:MAG TPA: carbohydrate kinase family protein [Candidatus Limnocylindria bacterium]|nr:carbohydrate kinase family protein [Candidatus Limnocylindria bacterium]